MSRLLTNAPSVAAEKRSGDHNVQGVPGLKLRVQPTGRAAFYFYYSLMDSGRQIKRKVRLGARGALTLDQARVKAAALFARTEAGEDPAGDVIGEKKTVSMTLGDIWTRRAAEDQKLAPSTRVENGKLLKRYAAALLTKPAITITAAEVMAVRNAVRDLPALRQADMVKTVISATYRWAANEQLLPMGTNPAAGIANVWRYVPKDRVLSVAELQQLLPVLRSSAWISADILLLLLLTGARRTEVASAKRAAISGDTWILDGDTTSKGNRIKGSTKNGRALEVPLSKQAAAIFRRVLATHSEPYVFPASRQRIKVGKKGEFPHVHPDGVNKALDRLQIEAGIVPPIATHIMRKTGATWMGENGCPYEVRRLLLNHVVETRNVTDFTYNRAKHLVERRDWLQRWADYIDTLAGDVTEVTARTAALWTDLVI